MDNLKSILPPAFSGKAVVIDIVGRCVKMCLCGSKADSEHKFYDFMLDDTVSLDDPVLIAEAIAENISRSDFGKVSTAVLLVPRSKAALVDMQMPAGTDENELPDMVRFQAEKDLPFAVDNAVLDFRPTVICSDGSVDVTVYAVQTATADFYRTIASEAGFSKISLTLRPLALAECAAKSVEAEPGECFVITHISDSELEINFLVDSQLKFSRSAAFATCEAGEISPRVLREINLSIQAFSASFASLSPTGMLLCGDTQLSEKLCSQLTGKNDLDCDLFRPAFPADAAGQDQSWPAVIGASLELPSENSRLPDLLHPRKARDTEAEKKRTQALMAAVVAAAFIMLCFLGYMQISSLSKEAQAINQQKSDAEKHSDKVQKLVDRVNAIKDWSKQSKNWIGHFAKISALAPSPEKLYISSLKTDSKDSLVLSVRAKDRETVEQFIASLTAVNKYDVTSPMLPNNRIDPLELGYEYEADVTISLIDNFEPELPEKIVARPEDDVSERELPQRLNRRNSRRRR